MDKVFLEQERTQSKAAGSHRIDAVTLLVTAPFLLASTVFPRPVVVAALILLIFPQMVRLVRSERPAPPDTAGMLAAIMGLVLLPLSFWLSPASWSITWPRITTLAWSLALYVAVANWPETGMVPGRRTRLRGPVLVYLVGGAAVAILGLLGMRAVNKLFFLPQTGLLAGRLGWENGLPTNEIAGALTLFVPLAAALSLGCWLSGRRRQVIWLLPLALLLAATLVLTQSRTALAAAGLGTVLALSLAGRPGRRWAVAGLVAAGVLLVLAGVTPLLDWFIFAGANSWQSVIGPRLGIWGQAIDGINDHRLWGMGFGTFGTLARLVYPLNLPDAAPVLEDAHNLYLQSALDFGLAGAAIFLLMGAFIALNAARLVSSRPPRSLSRLWAAGLLGALVAHGLYSLTDAVALGTPAGVPLWFLFGMVGAAAPQRNRHTSGSRWAMTLAIVLAGLLLFSALNLPANRAGQLAAVGLLDEATDPAEMAGAIAPLAGRDCRVRWYEGLMRHAAGDASGRAAAWGELLKCSERYTGYMAVLAAGDEELARRAVAEQPGNPDAHFWLASLLAADNPDEAAEYYRRGLALAPGDGRRWLALADLLAERDAVAALESYLQACRNGDPGANGCYRAGLLAEAVGDAPAAIEYYRLSNWDGALARADELERQLAAGQ